MIATSHGLHFIDCCWVEDSTIGEKYTCCCNHIVNQVSKAKVRAEKLMKFYQELVNYVANIETKEINAQEFIYEHAETFLEKEDIQNVQTYKENEKMMETIHAPAAPLFKIIVNVQI